ncbi:MAG: NYN domain-containing protein [Candidatus Goldbacteria bacterium]|nr:NYN domain-containing protein [Candidatus Goldiibacteriota bacterium]
MHIIIDGYNLMHCMKLKGESFKQQREYLIYLLQQFLAINEGNITVVFDGHKNISEHKSIEKHGKVKVIYSAKNQSADDVIIEMLMKGKEKVKNIILITSDRKLINFASAKKIKIMSSLNFAEYFE